MLHNGISNLLGCILVYQKMYLFKLTSVTDFGARTAGPPHQNDRSEPKARSDHLLFMPQIEILIFCVAAAF